MYPLYGGMGPLIIPRVVPVAAGWDYSDAGDVSLHYTSKRGTNEAAFEVYPADGTRLEVWRAHAQPSGDFRFYYGGGDGGLRPYFRLPEASSPHHEYQLGQRVIDENDAPSHTKAAIFGGDDYAITAMLKWTDYTDGWAWPLMIYKTDDTGMHFAIRCDGNTLYFNFAGESSANTMLTYALGGSPATVLGGNAHVITCVRRAPYSAIWLDGVKVAEDNTKTGTLTDANYYMRVGNHTSNGGRFQGNFWEFVIHKNIPSGFDPLALYNGIVSLWPGVTFA